MPTTGKAFEYACLIELENLLESQDIQIEENEPLNSALNAYNEQNANTREEMRFASRAGMRVILRLEPQLTTPMNNVPLILSIQSDAHGIAGDVRDLLCIRQQNNWEIGISCKHNHNAVKHSRLSPTIDFGNDWFGYQCSQQYFNRITPIFNELRQRTQLNETWRNVPNKAGRIYRPLLEAFIEEIRRLYDLHGGEIPNRLLAYLIGRRDFYKLIDRPKRRNTHIQAYNMSGTLNRNAGENRVNRVPNTPLPRTIFNIGFKPQSNNTVQIVCDNGWTVSLRIHNATTLVEPSLKFDVNLIGVPQNLYSHDEPWE